MTCEEEILEKYSTPGLRKNQLTRDAKRVQLLEQYKFLTKVEIDELLDKLFPMQGRKVPRMS